MSIENFVPDRHNEKKKEDTSFDPKRFFTMEELLRLDVRQMPMLWGTFLPERSVSFLAGSSDCGKSTLTRQLATAICRGNETFLGSPLNPKHRRALIVSTEDDEQGVAFSLLKQVGTPGLDFSSRLSFLFDQGNILRDVDYHLERNRCDLVVVDTWSDTFSGNPNDFVQVRRAMKPWKEISHRYGSSILLLHHMTKNSESSAPDKNRLNGSQGIESSSRSLLELRRGATQDQRLLSILKGNFTSDEEKSRTHLLSFDSDTLSFSSEGETVEKDSLKFGNKVKYEWIKEEARLLRDKDTLSFTALKEALVKKYGNEKVPSLTWFKENI